MANKIYYKFDDKDWLKAERQGKSATEIAEEQGCHRGSVEWACRGFSVEEKASFKYEKKPHKNRRN